MRVIAAALTMAALLGCSQSPEEPAPSGDSQTQMPDAAPTTEAEGATDADTADANTITSHGWGAARIGMTSAELTAALGPDAHPEAVGGPDPDVCTVYRPERAPEGMYMMVENGVLTRITVSEPADVQTVSGIGIGDSAAAVSRAYGERLVVEPHHYLGLPAKYLTWWDGERPTTPYVEDEAARGIRFETDLAGKVMAIHAGGPSIQYIEGCA